MPFCADITEVMSLKLLVADSACAGSLGGRFAQGSSSVEGGDIAEHAAAGQHQHLPGCHARAAQPVDCLPRHTGLSIA